MMKYLLFYESADDVLAKAPAHAVAHRAYFTDFSKRGSLLMIGPFEDPADGALGVFASREEAETFARSDPFVLHGVVVRWFVRGWNEVLT